MKGLDLSWTQILDLATNELEDILNELDEETMSRMSMLESSNLTNSPAYANYYEGVGEEYAKMTENAVDFDMDYRESLLIRISMNRQFLRDRTSTQAGAQSWDRETNGVELKWQAHAILSDFYAGEVYRDSDLWQAIEKADVGDMSLSDLLDRAAALFESRYPQFSVHWTPGQGEFYEI